MSQVKSSDPVGKMKKNGMRPVPPGDILNEEFLKPLDDALCRNDRSTRRLDGGAG